MTTTKRFVVGAAMTFALAGLGATSAVAAPAAAGTAVAAYDPAKNQPAYWEAHFEALGYADVQCYKVDREFKDGYVVPAEPDGRDWLALILKAGSGDDANEVIMNPTVGKTYYWRGDAKDISHVILCSIAEKKTTPAPTTPAPTTPAPTTPGATTPAPTTPGATTPGGTTPTKPGGTTRPSGPTIETDGVEPAGSNTALVGGGLALLLAGGTAVAVASSRRGRKH